MKYNLGPYRNTELAQPRAEFDPEGYCIGVAVVRQILIPVRIEPGRDRKMGPSREAVLEALEGLKSTFENRLSDTILEIREGEFELTAAGEGEDEEIITAHLITPRFETEGSRPQ